MLPVWLLLSAAFGVGLAGELFCPVDLWIQRDSDLSIRSKRDSFSMQTPSLNTPFVLKFSPDAGRSADGPKTKHPPEGIRVKSVRFSPKVVRVGDDLDLHCVFELHNERIYSLKWYKEEVEFFRLEPRSNRSISVFPVKGIHLDVSRKHRHWAESARFLSNLCFITVKCQTLFGVGFPNQLIVAITVPRSS